jgi:hypothetical protein
VSLGYEVYWNFLNNEQDGITFFRNVWDDLRSDTASDPGTPESSTILDRDSSVGIATRYGLDGPGIESRLVARFSAHVQTGPGPSQPPVQ